MGLGSSFVHAFSDKSLSKLERSEAEKFRHRIKGLSQMGAIGTILLDDTITCFWNFPFTSILVSNNSYATLDFKSILIANASNFDFVKQLRSKKEC